ncbi:MULTISPECIES: O-methyltransferase [Streptomyces]|uniref:Putative O-methyltransferase YrrM n=1 Tax=Streptomyces nymphaeiformis TaxID=2663842 RepID=A0A7W7TYH6_9ACTN|nr:O-methyltransferase [Streptomyces nymphaeiformis]MBB4981698.1 putative O-methyltransferase YrrM [Streptomyces nymphaeiformis]
MSIAPPTGYVRAVLGPRDEVLDRVLRRSLDGDRMPTIMVDDAAGRLLQLLTLIQRPRRVVEVGTLFGYSAIHIARGLPPGGRLTTLENDPAAAALARENFEIAGVADRVDLVVGNAADHLAAVEPGSVGMLFIDADKKSYPTYLKLGFPLLEPGGLLVADDAFAQGDFGHESGGDGEAESAAIHTYCRAVGRSPLLFSAFAGSGTGLLISRRLDDPAEEPTRDTIEEATCVH